MKFYTEISLMTILASLMGCGPEADLEGFAVETPTIDAKPYRRVQTERNKFDEKGWQTIGAGDWNRRHQTELIELAKKFAPQLREHKDEKFPLSNVDAYLSQVGLALYIDGIRQVLLEPGEVTKEALEELPSVPLKRERAGYETVESLDPMIKNIVGVTSSSLNEKRADELRFFIPQGEGKPKDKKTYDNIAAGKTKANRLVPICYAYPHYVRNFRDVGSGTESDDRLAIEIVYFFFNAYNGTVSSSIPGVRPLLDKLGVGHHEADFERITIRLNGKKDKSEPWTIEGVHYGSHGGNEGIWYFYPRDDLKAPDGYKVLKDGQVVAWSAKDTHGLHNRAGSIKRTNAVEIGAIDKIIGKTGTLTEETGDGNIIDCRGHLDVIDPVNPLEDGHYWLAFAGRWGDKTVMGKKQGGDGPPGPIYQNFWWAEVQNPETWLNKGDEKREPPPVKKGWFSR